MEEISLGDKTEGKAGWGGLDCGGKGRDCWTGVKGEAGMNRTLNPCTPSHEKLATAMPRRAS